MWTVLYLCIEYHIEVNMYHVRAQGVDERMINVHYYYVPVCVSVLHIYKPLKLCSKLISL